MDQTKQEQLELTLDRIHYLAKYKTLPPSLRSGEDFGPKFRRAIRILLRVHKDIQKDGAVSFVTEGEVAKIIEDFE